MTETDQHEAPDGPKRCAICNHISHGYHFGVLSCRACAAFFRRTIIESKVYKCLNGTNCVINRAHVNMCRACRFLRCEESGMNKNEIQLNRDPIGHRARLKSEIPSVQKPSHGPNYIPTPSTYLSAPSNPINVPQNYNPPSLTTLERIDFGCKEYFFGQPTPGENVNDNRPSVGVATHGEFHQEDPQRVPNARLPRRETLSLVV
uniref:Nuclear receptor domain-containing protein n=1 Tax=Panagrellus redivivus TaxID=6233 RepID=A0A7E4W564_PANRE